MAYNTIVTQNIYASGDNLSSSVKAPVGDTRAFVETINQGLKQLIDNDIALNQRKIDGKNGGQTVLISGGNIDIYGTDNTSQSRIGIPLRIQNNGSTTFGAIHEAAPVLIAPTEVISYQDIGHLTSLPKYSEVIISGSTARAKIVNIYANESFNLGKEVTFFTNSYEDCNMQVILRIYDNLADYNGKTGTNMCQNNIHFGAAGFSSVSFITLLGTDEKVFFQPTSYSIWSSDGSFSSTYRNDLQPTSFAD